MNSPAFNGTTKKPVSGKVHEFKGSAQWLKTLAQKNLFAVRLGVLKFRGFKPGKILLAKNLTDEDFKPDFEQKGVDMRIGLDIATYSTNQAIDRIILLSNDSRLHSGNETWSQSRHSNYLGDLSKLQSGSRTSRTLRL